LRLTTFVWAAASNSVKTIPTDIPEHFRRGVERLDGDANLLRQMASLTGPLLRPLLADAVDAIDANDVPRAITYLHRLKGMLSTFDADGVTIDLQMILAGLRGETPVAEAGTLDDHRDAIESLIDDIVRFGGGAG